MIDNLYLLNMMTTINKKEENFFLRSIKDEIYHKNKSCKIINEDLYKIDKTLAENILNPCRNCFLDNKEEKNNKIEKENSSNILLNEKENFRDNKKVVIDEINELKEKKNPINFEIIEVVLETKIKEVTQKVKDEFHLSHDILTATINEFKNKLSSYEEKIEILEQKSMENEEKIESLNIKISKYSFKIEEINKHIDILNDKFLLQNKDIKKNFEEEFKITRVSISKDIQHIVDQIDNKFYIKDKQYAKKLEELDNKINQIQTKNNEINDRISISKEKNSIDFMEKIEESLGRSVCLDIIKNLYNQILIKMKDHEKFFNIQNNLNRLIIKDLSYFDESFLRTNKKLEENSTDFFILNKRSIILKREIDFQIASLKYDLIEISKMKNDEKNKNELISINLFSNKFRKEDEHKILSYNFNIKKFEKDKNFFENHHSIFPFRKNGQLKIKMNKLIKSKRESIKKWCKYNFINNYNKSYYYNLKLFYGFTKIYMFNLMKIYKNYDKKCRKNYLCSLPR